MATGFYYDERCMWHSQGEHALYLPVGGFVEPPANGTHVESGFIKRRFRNLVEVSGLMAHLDLHSAPPATRADLERVHPASYLDRFKMMSDAGGGDMGEDARFSPGGYEIAALAAGLAMRGIADVMSGKVSNAYVLARPPGHHCLPDRGMGFCLMANIPVALEAMRAAYGPARVAVVDWDVHHGNGTEAIYYDRDDTLTISLHQEACYPIDSGRVDDRGKGAGAGFNLNVPLLPGGGHRAYLDAMEVLVVPALRAFRPDLIVVASGLDASGVDPLARMLAHSDTFREMTRILMAEAGALCGGRLVAVHEGGYSEIAVPFCGLAIVEELSGHRTGVEDPLLATLIGNQPAPDMADFQRARLEAQARKVFGD
ncbi:class II histone deacetylase [Defluviimonas sp. WL0002]|uniref:Class II histone deacetylase n=1 Tax=Albidovulum marisflavi TaxID=2984159 RepID=A0ABT2ZG40_9RHOB|nr:class II histone deacetylase [Defluviimonas sp. WL0002]MCV2869731.1 class II histone deacetylase [Defluviimonas sp. WL0002]